MSDCLVNVSYSRPSPCYGDNFESSLRGALAEKQCTTLVELIKIFVSKPISHADIFAEKYEVRNQLYRKMVINSTHPFSGFTSNRMQFILRNLGRRKSSGLEAGIISLR